MPYFSDSLNFLSKLTPRRILNVSKILASYYYTRWSKKPDQWGMPMTVSIEPTTACNLKCPECPSGLRAFSRPTGNLKVDFFRKTMDELAEEDNQYGTHRLTCFKYRHLGENIHRAIQPVRMPNGTDLRRNFINLNFENFDITEVGDLQDMVDAQVDVSLTDNNNNRDLSIEL